MRKITNKEIIYYSLLAFPLAFIAMPIYIYLPQFYANNFSISLQEIGLILIISRFFDAVFDPLIGFLSDKFFWLKKKIILFSSILLGSMMIVLFNPILQFSLFWFLLITLNLIYLFFSLVQINYQSFAVSLSDDFNLKTKIISFRESFGVLGIIFAALIPTILFHYFSQTKSFFLISIFYFVILTFFALVFYLKTPDLKAFGKEKISFSFLKNSQIKKLLILFFFNSFALAIPAVLILFFIEIIIKTPNLTGLFMMIYFLGLLSGIPFWSKISKILNNKIKAWLISMFLVIPVFGFCYFVGQGDIWLYAIICLLSGFCFGADYCLFYSIITDLIYEKNLQKSESSIFGIINFIIKFSFCISSGALVYFLGEVRDNFPDFQKSYISFSYVILPCILKLISFLLLFKFNQKYYEKLN